LNVTNGGLVGLVVVLVGLMAVLVGVDYGTFEERLEECCGEFELVKEVGKIDKSGLENWSVHRESSSAEGLHSSAS
jgi:hypothetical protein